MSHNKTLFSFFIKNNHKTKISTQQLYFMYTIFHKYDTTLTFNQFYLYIFLFTNFFKKISGIYLFLGYLFFFKTPLIKSLSVITTTSSVTNINNITKGGFDFVFFDF